MKRKPITRLLLWTLLFILFISTLILGTQAYMRLQQLGQVGNRESFVTDRVDAETGDTTLVFVKVKRADFPGADTSRVLPQPGDTITALNGKAPALSRWREHLEPPRPPGTSLTISFRQSGEVHSATLTLRPLTPTQQDMFFLQYLLYLVGSLAMMLIIGWTLLKQGENGNARLFSFFALSVTTYLVMSLQYVVPVTMVDISLFGHIPALGVVLVLGSFASGAWLHFSLRFPYPSPLLTQRPLLTLLLSYGVLLPLAWYSMTTYSPDPATVYDKANLFTLLYNLIPLTQAVAGVVILLRKRKRTEHPVQARQLTIVALGTGTALIGMMAGALVLVALVVLGVRNFYVFGLIGFGFIVCMLMIPVSFMVAIQRSRLLELELTLRRGTRYTLISLLLLLVFFAALYYLSDLLLTLLKVDSRAATVTIALLLALAFLPLQRWLQKWLERRLFPERQRLRNLLNDIAQGSEQVDDRQTLFAELASRLKSALGTQQVLPLLLDEDREHFHDASGTPLPFPADGCLANALRGKTRLLLLEELKAESEQSARRMDELDYLEQQEIELLIPLRIGRQLRGAVGFAFEGSISDLATEDLGVLMSLINGIALQSENIRLLEQTVEKKRMEEQLEMARQVQLGFLPSELPETPGLDIAAVCEPSLEVAGDYYDIIQLSSTQTLLAIGDVSGKGAGAAMLMANLQASLRSLAEPERELPLIVARINRILSSNTTPEQYITFFVAVVDTEKNTLKSVNAGHNPPFLLAAEGELTPLEAGGPVLGVLPDAPYQQEEHEFAPGALLFSFTDGASEAMNPGEEEFGEARLSEILRSREGELAAETFLSSVLRHIRAFMGQQPPADDLTLMLIRRLR